MFAALLRNRWLFIVVKFYDGPATKKGGHPRSRATPLLDTIIINVNNILLCKIFTSVCLIKMKRPHLKERIIGVCELCLYWNLSVAPFALSALAVITLVTLPLVGS